MAGRDDTARRGHLREWWVPAIVWIIATVMLSAPDVRDTLARAFGAPVVAVVAVVQGALMLPLLWALVHAQRIARQALADGGSTNTVPLMWRQRALGARHPDLRRSQQVCAFGLLYFMILCGAWIAYAHHRGI